MSSSPFSSFFRCFVAFIAVDGARDKRQSAETPDHRLGSRKRDDPELSLI
jgi:hypothetical protein